jgi:hypothetical protein
MEKYGYNLTFEEVSHLLEILSKSNDPESSNIKNSLSRQLTKWEEWDIDLKKILNSERPHLFTGI